MTDSSNPASPTSPTPLIQSDAVYDKLKQFAQVYLPAIGTLYFALSQIWGLPSGAEVVGTITAVDTFLGLVLHISSTQYDNSEVKYDGAVQIYDGETKKTYSLDLHDDIEDLDDKDEVVLKVKKHKA